MTGQSSAGNSAIAICVPARNEAAVLPQLFAALEQLDRRGVALICCLLLDSCDDDSAAISRDYAAHASFPVLIEQTFQSDANAGRARHRAMLLGLRTLDGAGFLLTTDADSAPATDWLQAMAAGLRCADVVAGKVVRTVTQPNPIQDRLEHYYEALHTLRRILDPVEWESAQSHHQTSGANLGLLAGCYNLLGGFPPLPSGEDAWLVDEAARAGLRVRRDAASVVYTSDRRISRVLHGFASGLRTLDGDGEALSVAHPLDVAWQYRGHALARRAYDFGEIAALAAGIGLTSDHVIGVARDSPNAEAFAMRVVPTPLGGMRRVSLRTAEAELAMLSAGQCAA